MTNDNRQVYRAKLWTAFEIKRIKFYPKNEKLIAKALKEQIDLVLESIDKYGLLIDPISALDGKQMADEIEELYVDTGAPFVAATYNGILKRVRKKAKKNDFEPIKINEEFRQEMSDYAKIWAADLIKNINRTNEKIVRRTLDKAAKSGYNANKTADLLRKEWGELSRARARTIARTETVRASNVASIIGAEKIQRDTGLVLQKEWITTIDGNEREAHKQANGNKVPLNSRFNVDGELLEHPGDPDAKPENTINCRCALGYVSNFLNE